MVKFTFCVLCFCFHHIDYQDAGYALVDLIEKSDGFHPSQAGNALFATQFFAWLEAEHPEALGPVNPFNAEIDQMFFSNQKTGGAKVMV